MPRADTLNKYNDVMEGMMNKDEYARGWHTKQKQT